MREAVYAVVLALAASAAQADVTATDAWVRATVPAQKTTGAFVTLTSTDEAKLVAVSTPAAKSVEIHTSEESHGVMHMHAVETVVLPAGRRVEFKPGSYHIMLVGLTHALAAGDKVPLTLIIESAGGKRTQLQVRAEVRPLGQ